MFKKILFLIALVLVFFSCKRSHKADHNLKYIDQNDVEIEKVFYSLPSPMEVANIIERSNLVFDPQLLHKIYEAEKYESDQALALNLGIYAADLSFAIVFKQRNFVTTYYNLVTKLADRLGILEGISDSLITQIKQNLEDPYKLQQLVNQAFFQTDAFLEDAHRENIATLILYGGWIETVYLTLSFAENLGLKDTANFEVMRLIADQRLVVDNLISLLEESNIKNKQYVEDLRQIRKKLINLTIVKAERVYDPIADTTLRVQVFDYKITENKLADLLKTISKIRFKYINLH